MSSLPGKPDARTERSFSGARVVGWQVNVHSTYAWTPPTDVYETESSFIVRVEVAGIREEDFSIKIEDNFLVISGVRSELPEWRAYRQMEIRFGEFSTAVEIPLGVDTAKADADYQDGFLNVVLPKLKPTNIIVKGYLLRMSASRWITGLLETSDWFQDSDSSLKDLLLPSIFTRLQKKDDLEKDPQGDPPAEEPEVKYPEVLPILPLRGVVVYPQTAVPLTIGQMRSIKLVDEVSVTPGKLIGLVAARNPDIEEPGPGDLYAIGTIATVHQLFRVPDNTIRLLVQGLARFRLGEFVQTDPYLKAKVEVIPETVESGLEIDALARSARDQFEQISALTPSIPRELVSSITSLEDPLQTAYTISNFQRIDLQDAQSLLEMDSTRAKLEKLVDLLVHETDVLSLGAKIQNQARSGIEKVQREYFLREQMKAIQKELGDNDEQTVDVEEFRKKIDAAKMPEEAGKQARREVDRLSRLPTAAAEYGVIRTYLDWLVTLPWSQATTDNLDIAHARKVLDQDHYGLQDIKERILEFLAVRKLRLERRDDKAAPSKDLIRRDREGVILCFIGPPGVGKTSLGQSIARAMERKFIRISLGGVRDEAEIRGHRRTYIGAMPGRILQALRRVESRNPVFMLDEVDKLTMDFHGDPASALLEVLDPEQNIEFRDNYLEVAYDLSQVFFITTANTLETIPAPLLDRMEIIQLSGYTESEKIAIARGYLIPRQVRENGLRPGEVSLTRDALKTIINLYTREAGVRNLERRIGAVCRKIGTNIAEGKKESVRVTSKVAKELLGHPVFMETEEIDSRTSIPGVVPGLAWTPFGGDILFIEATKMPGAKGFQITGSVGNVMQESARAALSYVRSHAESTGLAKDFFDNMDIHMHVPAGAQPKDGPSAGVTMTTALVSLLSGRPVKKGVGMTGEVTLRGQVLPVGGIKEKMIAAHRAGLKTIILPKRNQMDLEDLPAEVRKAITFVFAETVDDVLKAALEPPARPAKKEREEKRMLKVLLADDDYTMVALLKTLLGMEGYQVETLLDKPGDILENIRHIKPDILLIDIFLGDRNGLDVVRQIRQMPDLNIIRIIMASGIDKTEECLAAGADKFLLKPYMPNELFDILRS